MDTRKVCPLAAKTSSSWAKGLSSSLRLTDWRTAVGSVSGEADPPPSSCIGTCGPSGAAAALTMCTEGSESMDGGRTASRDDAESVGTGADTACIVGVVVAAVEEATVSPVCTGTLSVVSARLESVDSEAMSGGRSECMALVALTGTTRLGGETAGGVRAGGAWLGGDGESRTADAAGRAAAVAAADSAPAPTLDERTMGTE